MGPCRAPNSVTEVVYVDFRHRRRTRTETMTETDERGGGGRGEAAAQRPTSPARNSSETPRPRLNTLHRYGTRYVHPHEVFTSPVSMSHALTHCPLISLTLDPV